MKKLRTGIGMALVGGLCCLMAYGDQHHDILIRIIGPFGRCMTGPGPGVSIPRECSTFDKSGDGDIDLQDWALMEARR